jgi:hypothetical protein
MHGAHAGPHRGNRNAWKHGGRSGEMLRLRRQVRELLRESRELSREGAVTRAGIPIVGTHTGPGRLIAVLLGCRT